MTTDAESVLIVANPDSGGCRGLEFAGRLEASLRSRGISSEIRATKPGPDESLEKAILAAGIAIAVGGDGTLNRVVRPVVLAEPAARLPSIGFLPCGTANVATRAFGLPRNPEDVAHLVAAETTRAIDAGIAERDSCPPEAFILWLGAGVDAALLEGVAARRLGLGRAGMMAAYVTQAARMTFTYRFPEIEVSSPSVSGRFATAMVANVGPLAVGSITNRAHPGDGAFDLVASLPRSRPQWLLAVACGALGLYDRVSGVSRGHAGEVELASRERVPFHVDGEPCGTLPVRVRIKPSAIRLLCAAQATLHDARL